MITYDDARAGAEYARAEYESGDATSTINYQLTLRYPAANGFERNRMIFRGVTLFNIQTSILAGTPPASIIAPFPFPPSTGSSYHANDVDIGVTALIETPGQPDRYRTMVAHGISGDSYASYTAQIDVMIAFWMLAYPGSTVSVLNPARYVK